MNSRPSAIRSVTEAAAIAVLYYATARFGFLTALPPGNVTVVWPPSAPALAALLTVGYRRVGGVWFGSFLVNLSVLSQEAALPVAAAIATGSTLQAVSAPG